jgi:hypothetical protein
MASTSGSALGAALTASSPKRASTPASRLAAMAAGMRSIRRSKARVQPASTISAEHTRKAPTPSASVRPGVAAISAAPGVLQAVSTGWR